VRFRRLYKANYGPILSYALRRCGDVAEAHDIAADTFLVLWRRFAEAPVDEDVPLWLYGVARRIVANKHRSRVRADRLVGRLGHVLPKLSSTEERAEQREAANAVLRSLRRLKDDERELLLLAAWERLPASEIAIVLGCSPNAAAIRLHRARKRLADVYEKELSRRGHD
jgi:RNA polymerase sigma-70 factor (ECF subfamily)